MVFHSTTRLEHYLHTPLWGTLILHIPYSTITVVKHLVEYGQCYQSGESEFWVVVVIREKSSILGQNRAWWYFTIQLYQYSSTVGAMVPEWLE